MRTSKSSSKRGTGRTTATKNIDAEILQNRCEHNRLPVEGHPVIKMGINLHGEQMYFCELCGHIVGALVTIP
jgi:hypothetical protein